MAHVPYVHAGTVGNHAAFVDITIKTTPTSLHFDFPIENHTADGEEPMIRVETKASAFLPSTSFIHFNVPLKFHLGPLKIDTSWNPVTINSVVPIDEESTCIRFCNLRDFFQLGIADPLIAQYAFFRYSSLTCMQFLTVFLLSLLACRLTCFLTTLAMWRNGTSTYGRPLDG
jgi:hypothetical protein